MLSTGDCPLRTAVRLDTLRIGMAKHSHDDWLLQEDVVTKWFTGEAWFSEERGLFVYAEKAHTSYVESLACGADFISIGDSRVGLDEPYRRQRCSRIPYKLYTGHEAYLGRGLCNFLGWRKTGQDTYGFLDPRTQTVVAIRDRHSRYLEAQQAIRVDARGLVRFMKARGLALNLQITCHRWSERELAEFGLIRDERFRNATNFRYRFNLCPWDLQCVRGRMRSLSMLEGERVIEAEEILSRYVRIAAK